MIKNPVLIPFEGDAQLEIDRVIPLGDGQDVHKTGRHIYHDWEGYVFGNCKRRNFLVVIIVKSNKLTIFFIRFILAIHDLVTSLLHSVKTQFMNVGLQFNNF